MAGSDGAFPTFAFDKLYAENLYDLPHVPLPPLGKSVLRHLESAKPLCASEKEFEATRAKWADFEETVGKKLQADLEAENAKIAKAGTYPYHYFEQHWDAMYNGSRDCAPINFSPFFKITDELDLSKQEQCARAGAFVSSFAKWTRVILNGDLVPDTDPKGNPMCSSAFHRMFGTAKIPKPECDELAMHQKESDNVVVLCNGHVFTAPVVDASGKAVLDAAGCTELMRECVRLAAEPVPASSCVQAMTSAPRGTWAKVREELSSNNAAAFEAIDKALFVVCLDSEYWERISDVASGLLKGPCTNRWFDKHCLIVDNSGRMGICFEHSYSDGTGWGRFIRDVMMDAHGKVSLEVPTVSAKPGPLKELKWALGPDTSASINKAILAYDKLTSSVEVRSIRSTVFGKDQCKAWKLSPDAVAQMAYQIVYRMMHGKMAATYEACATRKFFHGRTETIRTVTPEASKLVEAVAKYKGGAKACLDAAAAAHGNVAKAAAGGLGCDRHLMALTKLAEKQGITHPALTDPVTARAKDWVLSTSNGSQPYIDLFGFGPVTKEGYGIGYIIEKDQMSFTVTSFKGSKSGTNAYAFSSHIGACLAWFKHMQECVAEDGDERNVKELHIWRTNRKLNLMDRIGGLIRPAAELAMVAAGVAVVVALAQPPQPR